VHKFSRQDLSDPLPGSPLAIDHDRKDLNGKIRQCRIGHFGTDPLLFADDVFAAAADDQLIARTDHCPGCHLIDDLPLLAEPFDENTLFVALHDGFEFVDGTSALEPFVIGAENPENDLPGRRVESGLQAEVFAHLLLQITRRLLHLRHAAQQPGSDRTQHPGGTRRTEDVSHRIANRHRAEIGFRSARQFADRIGRHAQHGRHRLRPGQQPRSLRKRIAHQPGEKPHRAETQQTDYDGEGHLRQSVLLQPPEELRADRIPHGEKEHQEEKGFGRFGNLDTKLPDDHAHQQHAGYRSERKAADAQLTQQKPQRNGQKDGQRRVRLDEVRELYTCKHNLSRFLR
jgi:hypothetical protein